MPLSVLAALSPASQLRRPIAMLMCAAVVAGCSTTTEEIETEKEPEERIAEAVETAANANRSVSEVEVAVSEPERPGPGQTVPPGVQLPEEARQPVSVDWQGRLEPMLEAIAARADYNVNVVGRAPSNPVTVTLTVEDEPLFDVVRRVGNMVHDDADVAMNPAARLIEIRYGG